MITNAAITIFNKYPDKSSGKFIYVPHYLPEVWFHAGQKTEVNQGNLASANEYKIRIPFPQEGWLPSESFQRSDKTEGNWTVQEGDFFLVEDWGKECVESITEIKKKFSGTVGIVLNHSENFFGSSPHIRIGGGD